MPLDGSAGYSEWTHVKQVHFESCFRKLLTIAGRCVDRHGGQLVVLDLTSGPGVVDGCAGSPSIIANVLCEHERAARVWFFERDPVSAESLRQMVAAFPVTNQRQVYTVVERDHADGVPWFIEHELPYLRGPLYGLVYVDANRRTHLSFEALTLLAQTKRLSRVDMLLNVAATSWWKRIRAVGKSERYFYDDIRLIPKAFRWFRAPVGPPQWTMIFLSNYEKLSPSKRLGFLAEHTREGQALLARLNESEAERLAVLQPMLPFGGDLNTVRTPNISAIRAIAPSAPSQSSVALAPVNAAASGE